MPDAPISKYEQELRKKILQNTEAIRRAYEKQIIEIAYKTAYLNYKGTPFKIADYPLLKRQIEMVLEKLQPEIYTLVVNSIETSWSLSNHKNDVLVDARLAGEKPVREVARILYDPNHEAMQKFIERREQGMNLSQRVWNAVDPFKKELEVSLGLGIANGTPARELATQLQRYLVNPDNLFRRVRGEDGKLKLSASARNFHPGQGVYRSSYKNALRLAGTEINMAYRTADHTRWLKLPFVTGIEVHTSRNHPKKDICDDLEGDYPKEFLFRGWHPQCRCFQVPKMMTDDAYEVFESHFLEGSGYAKESVKTGIPPHWSPRVIDMPDSFIEWMLENKKTIAGWASKPYFVGDNPQYTSKQYLGKFELELITKPEIEKRIKEIAGTTQVNLNGLSRNIMKTVLRVFENESKFGQVYLNKVYTYNKQSIGLPYPESSHAAYNFAKNELVINTDRITETPLRAPQSFEEQLKNWNRLLRRYGKNPFARIDIESKIDDVKDRMARGEKPKVFNQMTTYKDYQDRIAAVLYHEFGHFRYFQLYKSQGGIMDNMEIERWGQERFGDDFPGRANSLYGESETAEFFAEWYSWYRMRGPSGVPQSVMQVIWDIENLQIEEGHEIEFRNEGITDAMNYNTRLKSLPPVYSPEGIEERLKTMDRITKPLAQTITTQIMKNIGLDLTPNRVVILEETPLEQLQKTLTGLNELSKEYTSPLFANDKEVLEVDFYNTPSLNGQVVYKPSEPGILRVNFGSVPVVKDFFHASVDTANKDLSSTYHEFAHMLTNNRDWVINNSWRDYEGLKQVQNFWREADKIYAQYDKELERVANDKDKFDALVVSEYADRNINEFVAECFTNYKLSSHPKKYAQKIGNLVDKYFKR